MHNHIIRLVFATIALTVSAQHACAASLQWNKQLVNNVQLIQSVMPDDHNVRKMMAKLSPSMNGASLVRALHEVGKNADAVIKDPQSEQLQKQILASLFSSFVTHIHGQLITSLQAIDNQINVLTYNREHAIKRYFYQLPTQWAHNTPEAIHNKLAELRNQRNQALTMLGVMTEVMADFNHTMDSKILGQFINRFIMVAGLMNPLHAMNGHAESAMLRAVEFINAYADNVASLCINARAFNAMNVGYQYFKPVAFFALTAAGSYAGYNWVNGKINGIETHVNDPVAGVAARVNQRMNREQQRAEDINQRILNRVDQMAQRLGQRINRQGGLDRDQLVDDVKQIARKLRAIGVINIDDAALVNQAEDNTLQFIKQTLLNALLRHVRGEGNHAEPALNPLDPTDPMGINYLYNVVMRPVNRAMPIRYADAVRLAPELLYLMVSAHQLELLRGVNEQYEDIVAEAQELRNLVHDTVRNVGEQTATATAAGVNGALFGARIGSKVVFGGITASALCYSLYKIAMVQSTMNKDIAIQQLNALHDLLMHFDNVSKLDPLMRGELIYRASLLEQTLSITHNDRVANALSVLYDAHKSPFNKIVAIDLIRQLVKPA